MKTEAWLEPVAVGGAHSRAGSEGPGQRPKVDLVSLGSDSLALGGDSEGFLRIPKTYLELLRIPNNS